MALAAASRLGPYQIIGPLGAGGMGEVYRATDSRLARNVALKVLPDVFACDAERMARFEREAKVLASLNHANIASLYGFEESGNARAIIMELVEGPILAQRISRGPLPLDDALRIAGKWPMHWNSLMSAASSIATSNPRTLSSPPTDKSKSSILD